MQNSKLSFESLIAPITTPEFLNNYREKAHLFVSRKDARHYDSLLSLADVDGLIFLARENPRDLLSIVPPPGKKREQRRYRVGDITMEKLYAAFNSGDTIRLGGVQEFSLDLAKLAASFGEALGAKVNINLYMTPADSQAFPVHFDTHDGFIMQVDGSKEWRVYAPYYPLPVEKLTYLKNATKTGQTRSRGEDEMELLEEMRLETGDLLYIPRGFPHKAVTSGQPSLHLTVGTHPVCWLDILKAAVEVVAVGDVELRKSLGPGFAEDSEVRDEMISMFRSLLDRVYQGASFEKTWETLTRSLLSSSTYPPDGYFADVTRLDDLKLESTVQRRKGMDCLVEYSDDNATILFAANHVKGPRAIGPALEYVRNTATFRISDLPSCLGDEAKLTLVRRLVQEGLLRTATPTSSSLRTPLPEEVSV